MRLAAEYGRQGLSVIPGCTSLHVLPATAEHALSDVVRGRRQCSAARAARRSRSAAWRRRCCTYIPGVTGNTVRAGPDSGAHTQTAERRAGGEAVTFRNVAKTLLREEGARGLARGLLPRIANVAVWGTCMVSCYEFLKRICVLDDADARA